MTPAQRKAKRIAAAVALLQALTEDELQAVLDSIKGHGLVVLETPHEDVPRRVCATCGLGFSLCRRRALNTGDDHDFEAITT